jgi:hypothetical protein
MASDSGANTIPLFLLSLSDFIRCEGKVMNLNNRYTCLISCVAERSDSWMGP